MQLKKILLNRPNLDGSSFSDRIEKYTATTGWSGENISFGTVGGEEIVLDLVVDDGVKSRGHRDNIFKKAFNYLGVGHHDHPTYGICTVFDYCGGLVPIKSKPASYPKSSGGSKSHTEESKKYDEPKKKKLKDSSKSTQAKIKSKEPRGKSGATDSHKTRKEAGTRKVEKASSSSGGSKAKHSKEGSKSSTSTSSHDEPTDYQSKSTEIQTSTCGRKKTVKTTTTYQLWDGSTQVFTQTDKTTT